MGIHENAPSITKEEPVHPPEQEVEDELARTELLLQQSKRIHDVGSLVPFLPKIQMQIKSDDLRRDSVHPKDEIVGEGVRSE